MPDEKSISKFYKFKEQYVFGDGGGICHLSGTDKDITIFEQSNQRGDGVITSLKIDLFNGEINECRFFFDGTYIKNVDIVRSVGSVKDLTEISEKEAKEILSKNKPSVGSLIARDKLPF